VTEVLQQFSLYINTARAFPVAAPWIWNSLLEHVVTAATLQSFKKHLKTFLLQRSHFSGPRSDFGRLGHYKN